MVSPHAGFLKQRFGAKSKRNALVFKIECFEIRKYSPVRARCKDLSVSVRIPEILDKVTQCMVDVWGVLFTLITHNDSHQKESCDLTKRYQEPIEQSPNKTSVVISSFATIESLLHVMFSFRAAEKVFVSENWSSSSHVAGDQGKRRLGQS